MLRSTLAQDASEAGEVGVRIGFALLSNSRDPIPSTRIACLNIFPALRERGFDPVIIFEPNVPSEMPAPIGVARKALEMGCLAVVLQKIHGPCVLALVDELRAAGIATVYCVCDLVDDEMALRTDATIVVTEFLRTLYAPSLQEKIFVAHDGIEHPEVTRVGVTNRAASSLRAVLVTSQELYRIPTVARPTSKWSLDVVGRFPPQAEALERLRAIYWALGRETSIARRSAVLLSAISPRVRRIAWDPVGVYRHLAAADIGVIPVDTTESRVSGATMPDWMVKSENRLTMKMAVGLPVIATPIPAYEEVIHQGENGFLAVSREDWIRCYRALEDPERRREMGERARSSVLRRYSIEAQADSVAAVLRRLV